MYRQRVVRADGRTINVVQRRAHLSYCFRGCCCGRTERGYAPVSVETLKAEWLRRKLRNSVHLTKAGRDATGGPRDLAVAMGAVCVRLKELDETSVLHLIRHAS